MTPNPLSQLLGESLEQNQSCRLQSPTLHHSTASQGRYHEGAKPFQLGEQRPADSSVPHWPCADISSTTLWPSALGPVYPGGQSAQPSTFDLGSPGPVLSCWSLLVPGELGGLPGAWTPALWPSLGHALCWAPYWMDLSMQR